MNDPAADVLASHRPMLLGLAYRMLGSMHDAEDVLQEAYLKWQATDRDAVREPRRYLSRTVTRLAIDRLRHRHAHEVYPGPWLPEPVATATATASFDPAESLDQRDSLATATLFLMERLNPVARAVFVLRSAFDLPYDDIAETVQRTAEHCRQLHRRAAQRLATDQRKYTPSRIEHRELLERFLVAAREGDLTTLRSYLHADVVAWSDGGGKVRAARRPVLGADRVARFFAGIHTRQRYIVEHLLVNGTPGALTSHDGIDMVLTFTVADGRISGLFLTANPAKVDRFVREHRRGTTAVDANTDVPGRTRD